MCSQENVLSLIQMDFTNPFSTFQPTCWGYDWTENTATCATHEKDSYDKQEAQTGTVHVQIGETCRKSEIFKRFRSDKGGNCVSVRLRHL